MKNKNYNKREIFPWDIDGYVKLSKESKEKIIFSLFEKYKTVKDINKVLKTSEHFFLHFRKYDKIKTVNLKKMVLVLNEEIIKDIVQFNDDKGSSSIAYTGSFPIIYTPLWHFLFCLSIGDGNIKKGKKRQFVWYQKPEGQKQIIQLLKDNYFNYTSSIKKTKQGITIPQLIRKVGSFVTGLDTKELIINEIIEVSSKLGKDFEFALLCAFFMDEAGMGTIKSNSEITLHQEGNLLFLEKIGFLLDKYDIKWSKNKKKDKWVIRIKLESIVELSKMFDSLNKYGISLFHRENIFQEKVKMARKTQYTVPLKKEAVFVRKYLLNNFMNQTITLDEIRKYFKSNFNVSSRLRKLVNTMKKKNELKSISLGKYIIKGDEK